MKQSNIQSNHLLRWLYFLPAFMLNTKLGVVPIGTSDYSYPLDLPKLVVVKVSRANHAKRASFKAINEGDRLSIFRQLIPASFVLNGTGFFKLGKSFLARVAGIIILPATLSNS